MANGTVDNDWRYALQTLSYVVGAVAFIAIAVGVNAPDGRSKTFDARADGYGRSEAVAAVFGGSRLTTSISLCSSGVQGRG